ncbi:SpdD-like protein [Streptomyces sp. NPDC051207]|uniref:SpdD-like protein n=1 Tax=Streptomyces sp. NPDC051207 TaxID=3154641 RepID=UPI00342F75E3
MFRPKLPSMPQPTGRATPPAVAVEPTIITPGTPAPPPAPVAPAPVSARPTVQLTPGSALALAAGGGAVVLVVGAVLVSMLLAVAITGVSVALVAVVLRLLVNDLHKGR